MVAAFDYCLHGRGGAAPSIDTAMHGLVDAAHVDHLHPDSGIALATAADGEALTRDCFGDRVAWVPWRRPGLPARPRHRRDPARPTRTRSARSSAATGSRPGARPPRRARRTRSRSSGRPSGSSPTTAGRIRSAPVVAGYEPLPDRPSAARARPRSSRSSAASPRPTARRSATSPTATSSSTSSPARSTRGWPRSGRRARTTSCGRRSGRWSSTCRRPRRSRTSSRGCASCTPPTATTTPPTTSATPTPDSPPMRGADPAIVLVPGRRHVQLRREQADRPRRRRVLRQRDQRHARRRGASRRYAPDPRGGEVPDRVLGARGGQARAAADAEAARRRGSRS